MLKGRNYYADGDGVVGLGVFFVGGLLEMGVSCAAWTCKAGDLGVSLLSLWPLTTFCPVPFQAFHLDVESPCPVLPVTKETVGQTSVLGINAALSDGHSFLSFCLFLLSPCFKE